MIFNDRKIIISAAGSRKAVTDIIGYPIAWAPGLILKAEGYEAVFYKKE